MEWLSERYHNISAHNVGGVFLRFQILVRKMNNYLPYECPTFYLMGCNTQVALLCFAQEG